MYTTYVKLEKPVPEPVLWMVFEKLVDQCLIMEKGAIVNPGPNNWLEIVHRDIKPENVFLDMPDSSGYYPQYPTPKMADFGIAFETSPNDDSNPDKWVGAGTRPYFAPEAWDPVIRGPPSTAPDATTKTYKLNSKTNVWGT